MELIGFEVDVIARSICLAALASAAARMLHLMLDYRILAAVTAKQE
jgi:hypothetical protein